MLDQRRAREAAACHPRDWQSPCCPEAGREPCLAVNEIQGNILAGFNKDHQSLLFLKIEDAALFKLWLKSLVPFVASTWEVLTFNRLYKEVRSRRGESRALRSTWINVAFSFKGLKKLAPELAEPFKDKAFRQGLNRRSELLGDPLTGDGSPSTWVIGGPSNEADVVLIVASDLEADLLAEADRLERSLFTPAPKAGVRIIFKEKGAVLPPPRRGHEHFGFLDGISQPGIRGRVSADPRDLLTLRQSPRSPDGQGKPGQDLLWPGEFVFGYPGQDPDDPDAEGESSLTRNGEAVAPDWARNGSFLVFRRLRQDVAGFRRFIQETAVDIGLKPEVLEAKIVGRFRSGAPILRTEEENLCLGGDDCVNNDFEFAHEPEEEGQVSAASSEESACLCKKVEPAPPDENGLRCPFGGHIRKVYPRNDRDRFVPGSGEADAQKHRLIRRGIPYGPPFPAEPVCETQDPERGLLFLSYQTSIVDQFEHVQRHFANNIEQNPATGEIRAGHDLIIGQNAGQPRLFVVPLPDPKGVRKVLVTVDRQWVWPTGGGYFFSPSISALEELSGGDSEEPGPCGKETDLTRAHREGRTTASSREEKPPARSRPPAASRRPRPAGDAGG